MTTLLIVLVTLVVLHMLFWPVIDGFIDGWNDARNGKPYNNKHEKELEDKV